VKRKVAAETNRETTHYFCEYKKTGHQLQQALLGCRARSARGVTRKDCMKCLKGDVALCVDKMCFVDYHTKKRL
jgi:hypothetical protein